MRRENTIGLALLLVALVLLHFTVRPLLAWRVAIDFLTIGVLLVAVRVRPGAAALIGCVAGLGADALAGTAFGAAALAMTIVAFGASWLKAAFFAEHVMLNALFLFLGKLAFDVVYLIVERRLTGMGLLMQMAVWSPLSAALTAVTGLALLIFLRPLIEPDTPLGGR